MDEKIFFLQTYENIHEGTLPSPLIKHSNECKRLNNKRKKKNEHLASSTISKEESNKSELIPISHNPNNSDDKNGDTYQYICINRNKFNGKCYHKKIPIINDIHLNFTIAESLIYILNFYLQKNIISLNLYNRMLYSFQMAMIETLNELKEAKDSKWNIKGTLINYKKENNIQLLYVENAFLSLNNIIIHTPLLKIKSIDT
ncbi:conserved Plasmodium protein, unknown function [Plasmodium vinckei vinckei]|uniref:Uncharacterized protein n=1 Tax=Plasmodium vinckei vinckei TaxID=54757 RepID=A0A449BRS0_PLAVN|nr:conserved Plasmodium protein, unknown function [Plasmodium vinckei vinckei]KEG01954.1 hypothetical protein YYE_03473 [Plasmodium vinckei vinckei]VEV56160.1 conserved Plasmodium protein, unknown function [Plasmodium vinckei vinckei]